MLFCFTLSLLYFNFILIYFYLVFKQKQVMTHAAKFKEPNCGVFHCLSFQSFFFQLNFLVESHSGARWGQQKIAKVFLMLIFYYYYSYLNGV